MVDPPGHHRHQGRVAVIARPGRRAAGPPRLRAVGAVWVALAGAAAAGAVAGAGAGRGGVRVQAVQELVHGELQLQVHRLPGPVWQAPGGD